MDCDIFIIFSGSRMDVKKEPMFSGFDFSRVITDRAVPSSSTSPTKHKLNFGVESILGGREDVSSSQISRQVIFVIFA